MIKTPTNKECAALAKAYGIAAVSAVPLLMGLLAILVPVAGPQGPVDWGITGLVLALYLLFSSIQFALLVAMEIAGNARLAATVLYVLIIATVNFSIFGLHDGVRSLLMFLAVSALLYLPSRRFFLLRAG